MTVYWPKGFCYSNYILLRKYRYFNIHLMKIFRTLRQWLEWDRCDGSADVRPSSLAAATALPAISSTTCGLCTLDCSVARNSSLLLVFHWRKKKKWASMKNLTNLVKFLCWNWWIIIIFNQLFFSIYILSKSNAIEYNKWIKELKNRSRLSKYKKAFSLMSITLLVKL